MPRGAPAPRGPCGALVQESTRRWAGTYRCAGCGLEAVADARWAVLFGGQTDDELSTLFAVIVAAGVALEELQPSTTGKDVVEAAVDVLGAIEQGKLHLSP